MTDHNLLPEHGEKITMLECDARNALEQVLTLQRDSSILLAEIIALLRINDDAKLVLLPCKRCVLDAALGFRDLSEALKELADGH